MVAWLTGKQLQEKVDFVSLTRHNVIVSRQLLKEQYGQEVILMCSCYAHRSHLMDARRTRCPVCMTEAKLLMGDSWEEIELYYGIKR